MIMAAYKYSLVILVSHYCQCPHPEKDSCAFKRVTNTQHSSLASQPFSFISRRRIWLACKTRQYVLVPRLFLQDD